MPYDHSMYTEARLKAGTSLSQVNAALKPLTDYLFSLEEFSINRMTGDLVFSTSGYVCANFHDLVVEAAANLGPLTQSPSLLTLSDHSTADLENAIDVVFYGASVEAVEQFHFEVDLADAMAKLTGHLPAEAIGKLKEVATAVFTAKRANVAQGVAA